MELFTLICSVMKLIGDIDKACALIERVVKYIKAIAKKK